MPLLAGPPTISLIDYPPHVAAIFFFHGCSMRCPFCHNAALLTGQGAVSAEDALETLDAMSGLIDAVVISGGEPTLSEGALRIAGESASRGLKVKLDTNGTSPEVLRHMIGENMVDYVAMDLKSDEAHYPLFSGSDCDMGAIHESRDIIVSSRIGHEFRTTVVPGLMGTDMIRKIYKEFALEDADSYYLQRYVPVDGYVQEAHSPEEWRSFARELGEFPNIFFRGYSL